MEKKINIGAGYDWKVDGWCTLDNAPLKGKLKKNQFFGKCWDSKFDDNSFDIIFTSHTLEHVPHFRLEKTISEFNRILKTGGVLRIVVPSLRKAAIAYVKNNKNFFKNSKHYSDALGIGASFVRLIVSPGSQSILFSREMDEYFGGYAHLIAFDFKMLKTILEKWGFSEIRECSPGKSSVKEMREFQHIMINGKKYLTGQSKFNDIKISSNDDFFFYGFDKKRNDQLIVEAKKKNDVQYSVEKEFNFYSKGRDYSIIFMTKIFIFKIISKFVEQIYIILKSLKITRLFKLFFKR